MTGKNRKKTPLKTLSKKHSQPASSSNDSQGSEQGSVDTVDLIGTDPKYDINSPQFETAYKALMDDIGVDMNVIDELSDVQKECVKTVTVATKFDRSQTYTALSLMKPTMKDQSSSILTNKRAGEAIADFDEANGTSSVTLGDDGSYTALNNGRVHFKIWSKMNSFQRLAMRHLRKEWLENGGAEAEEVVEDRRPSQAPSSAPPSQLQHSTRTNDEPHTSRREPRARRQSGGGGSEGEGEG